uniref:HESX homeobox 1 n=1 Tax=Leptobrachium leishanense TaxID=445787 RepID=A0A8C5RBF9_9ANUR
MCEAGAAMSPNPQKRSCVTETNPTKCSFSIERILGLDSKKDLTSTVGKHNRPWMECRGVYDWRLPLISYNLPIQVDSVSNLLEKKGVSVYEKYCDGERLTFKRELSWYRGRRPRTAFSRNQIEILENVFRVNSYPGIDVREELATKLCLDEDRIQIWFQNRRAKLKRSHRETQFLMVKDSLTPNIQE